MSNQMMVMKELHQDQSLCDAVIQVEGTQFKVHRLVMCGCSTFFKSVFTTRSITDRNIHVIPNLSADIMQTFIEFAYTGVVTITKDNIDDLFIAADRFSVTGITQACCKVLEESLCPQTCLNTWWMTNNFNYPELKQKVFSYILRHFEELVTCPNFLQLSLEDLMSFIGNDLLNVRQESIVFEAILLWINHSPQDRQAHIKNLLKKVRLAFMDSQFFSDHIIGNEIVRQNRKCKSHLIRTMKIMLDIRTRGLPIRLSSSVYSLCRPRVPQAMLMVMGGWSLGRLTNAIVFYNNRSKRWVFGTNEDETRRAYHEVVFLNGCVYVIGGYDGVERLCTMHKYDLVHHAWQEVAPMHSRRCYVSVALLSGFIYAMGGFNRNERLDTAERYDPETNQWTIIASMNEQRGNASSTTLNGKIYICGGFNGMQCLLSAESYNPQTNQWTRIPDMSDRRSGVGVAAYAGEIYAVGGFNGMVHLRTMEAYNPETRRWRLLPPMFNPRSKFGIAVLDDELYVIGGFNGFTTINGVETFNFRSGVWSVINDMVPSCSSLSACIVYDLPNMADFSNPEAAFIRAADEE